MKKFKLFKKGQKVKWNLNRRGDAFFNDAIKGYIKEYGEGIFRIYSINNVPAHDVGKTGHPQLVTIKVKKNLSKTESDLYPTEAEKDLVKKGLIEFSGYWFAPV